MAGKESNAILKRVSNLRYDTKYADLNIICDGYKFCVHRNQVCPESVTLSKHVDGDFKEAKTGVIIEKLFDARTFARLLDYIYTGDYSTEVELPQVVSAAAASYDVLRSSVEGADDEAAEPARYERDEIFKWTEPAAHETLTSNDRMISHTLVYQIGGYYQVEGLQKAAVVKFKASAQTGVTVDGFVKVIEAVYIFDQETDHPLRRALVDVAYEHIHDLVANEDFVKDLAALDDLPAFYPDLLRLSAKQVREIGDQHTAEKTRLQQQIAAINTLTAGLNTRIGGKDREIQNLERLIRSLQPCQDRRCNQRFSFTVDRGANGTPLIRCQSCGQRRQ